MSATYLAHSLLGRFAGKGSVPEVLISSSSFLLAVGAGAGLPVMLATRCGFPVSTTHALVGVMIGSGNRRRSGRLGSGIFLTLAVESAARRAIGCSVLLAAALHGTSQQRR